MSQQWKLRLPALVWKLDFRGGGKRVGREVVVSLPVLSADATVFTPSERGVVDVSANPTFQATPYVHMGWEDNCAYVLPLVSVLHAPSDTALTIALPPNRNIPQFQVEWINGRTLRLHFGHRGMGGNQPSELELLLFAHAADYRSVIKAYSDLFPRYFRAFAGGQV